MAKNVYFGYMGFKFLATSKSKCLSFSVDKFHRTKIRYEYENVYKITAGGKKDTTVLRESLNKHTCALPAPLFPLQIKVSAL